MEIYVTVSRNFVKMQAVYSSKTSRNLHMV